MSIGFDDSYPKIQCKFPWNLIENNWMSYRCHNNKVWPIFFNVIKAALVIAAKYHESAAQNMLFERGYETIHIVISILLFLLLPSRYQTDIHHFVIIKENKKCVNALTIAYKPLIIVDVDSLKVDKESMVK